MTYAYTPETLADRWEVSPATVRNLIRRGQLTAFRIGRQLRIRPEAAIDYEDRQCLNGDLSSIAANTRPSARLGAQQSGSRSAPPIFTRRSDA